MAAEAAQSQRPNEKTTLDTNRPSHGGSLLLEEDGLSPMVHNPPSLHEARYIFYVPLHDKRQIDGVTIYSPGRCIDVHREGHTSRSPGNGIRRCYSATTA
jgi:hypothetical protein